MKTFVAAIPFFDSHMAVRAYRLCTHNSQKLLGISHDFQSMGEVLKTPGLDLLEEVGVEPFAGDRSLYVEVNPLQILMGVPLDKRIPAEKLVCLLSGQVEETDELIGKLQTLKQSGYGLAYESANAHIPANRVTDLMDAFLVSHKRVCNCGHLGRLCPAPQRQQLIIDDVPDRETYTKYTGTSNAWQTGGFFGAPVTEGTVEITPLKANALQLLRQVNEIDSDLSAIGKTIERDPAITISLLKFINSRAFNASSKIESIRNAVALLGQKEIKKWVMVAVSVNLAQDRPDEVTKLSLIRGKFAENLAPAFRMHHQASSLFMAGLFSLLDTMMHMPIEQAIKQVAVDEGVKQALVEKQGKLYKVLELIYAYERANWDETSILMIKNEIEAKDLNKAFIDALVWYRELLEDM